MTSARTFIIMVLTPLLLLGGVLSLRAQDLLTIVKSGDIKAVQKVVKKGKVNVNEQDAEGLTPLMVSAIAGDSDMVQLLLESRAEPNIQALNGMTALHAAAFHGRESVMLRLLTAGANPNIADNKGRTPLLVAAQIEVTNPVTILLESGADIEAKDKNSNNALLLSCGNRHLNILSELLRGNANPNARDSKGRTALMLLAVLGEDEMMRVLLKYKPDLYAVDFSLKSALAYAKEYKRKAVIKLLEAELAK